MVRNWISTLARPPDIVCLQETKADLFRLDLALNHIFSGTQQIIAPATNTRGGIAILISPSLVILSSGLYHDNQAAWVTL